MEDILLSARNVRKYYPLKGAFLDRHGPAVKAVDDVSLDVQRGEIFGLVGESGCGKSTLGRVLLRFEEPTAGSIHFQDENLCSFDKLALKRFRRQAQMIYQDPYSSLNPRRKIGDLIREPLDIHKIGTPHERTEKVSWLLRKVGMQPDQAKRYPHEFSGGQRQRIVVARALTLNPQLLIADEPVSALDVSTRAQVINLLLDLREEFGLTYVFISHDLSVVQYVSDRVAVMYLGRIVEKAAKNDFYDAPLHPYSRALLSAAPVPDLNVKKQRLMLQGDVPSPINPPAGCAFHPRCPLSMAVCKNETPELRERTSGHWVACHAET
jgi:oligopeptide/dipeptide ABC transporter ATP-binding protein